MLGKRVRRRLHSPVGRSGVDTWWKCEHFWMYLWALGFHGTPYRRNRQSRRSLFGDFGNSAFKDTMIFLFAKLDPTRAAAAFLLYRCSSEYKFRQLCCKWLREIANEDKGRLPLFRTSVLASYHSPKFVHLMYQWARYVLIEDMKRNSVGTDIPFAEAVKWSPSDKHMAKARRTVAYNKLLQIFQRKYFVTQEHKRKAELLTEEIEHLKIKYGVLQMRFDLMKQKEQTKIDKTERIEKVRSMWSFIMETLTSLKEEKEAVDSVIAIIQDSASQRVLDGTKVAPHVPQILMHRFESYIHQYCTGNLYEAENLNFLTVIQLLNAALGLLRDECGGHLHKELPVADSKVKFCKEVLQGLQSKSLNIQQKHCVTSRSNSGKQEDWKVNWKSFLDLSPSQNSTCDRLRALPFRTFRFPEEEHKSTFSRGLASILDYFASIQEVPHEKDDGVLETTMDNSISLWMSSISSVNVELLQPSGNRHVLLEKDLPVSPNIFKNGKDEPITSVICKNAGDRSESSVKKEDHLQNSRDEVAELIAEAVMSETPPCAAGEEINFEDIISSLQADPFITRKQIPRTPENLLTEIRSSWRKAIESEGASEVEMPPTEVLTDNAQMDARPIMQEAANSTFTSSGRVSPDSSLSKWKSEFSSMNLRPQGQMRQTAVLETRGTQENERTEALELNDIALNRSVKDPEQSFQHVQKFLNAPDICSENSSKTNVLPPGRFEGSLIRETSCWPILSLNSVSLGAGFLGILEETLPELEGIDSDVLEASDSSVGEEDMKKSKSNLQSLSNKKSASRSEEKLYQIHDGGESVSCRSDRSHSPEKRERDESYSPLQLICLDEEFNKPSSPKSDKGRKYSLSSLASCHHVKEIASMVHEIPLELIDKLKEKDQQNEKLGMMELASEKNL